MLGDYETQLIVAAVDGEMSAEERRAFSQLVDRSPAAAELYDALLRDRDQFTAIPRSPIPPALAAALADAVSKLPVAVPRAPAPMPMRSPRWVHAALAASFLVAVASGTYWYVAGSVAPQLAKRQIQQLPKDGPVFVPKSIAKPEPVNAHSSEEPIAPAGNAVQASDSAVASKSDPAPEPMPSPSPEPDRVLAAPVGNDVKAFDRVELKLPILASFADFANEDAQGNLKKNLARDSATRIDLFAKDTAKAAEALVAGAKKVNLEIQIETVANERMKRRMPSAWWIYTEALTPDEIARWFAETAAAENAAIPTDRSLGNVHAIPAGPLEQKDALSLIGVDLGLARKPGTPSDHISSKTIDQVAGSLRKTEQPKPGVLVTYLPPLVRVHPQLSKDIKQFNELRGSRKPGTVPLVVVVRPVQ
jgi:hypothetical protein